MRPTTQEELAEAISAAKGPLRIVGGGTRSGLGHPVAGDLLETGGLSGITLYEPGALTLVVQSGTPLTEVEAALDAEGQCLAFEPMDHRAIFETKGTPTIGAVAACNISGPRRIQAGACRDFMLGVGFVDGAGQIVKNGGRVMKNVTGYDLTKLLSGSYGTLGVLTEISFKVLPKPEISRTLMLRGLSDDVGCAALRAALGSPFDVTGAAHNPMAGDGPVTYIRIEGFEKSVTYRAEQLKTLLSDFTDQIETSDDPDHWSALRDVSCLTGQGDIWRISVKPSDGPQVAQLLSPLAHFFDWGGGLVWALMAPGSDVRAKMRPIAGHATLVRGSDETKAQLGVFQDEGPAIRLLSQELRTRFDPRGILNAGIVRQ